MTVGGGARREPREYVECAWCKGKHIKGIATARWHEAYSWIEREVMSTPHIPEGTNAEFYPGWILQLKAEDVRLQLWPILNKAIVKRDDYTCQDCGKKFEKGSYGEIPFRWTVAEVHHILPRGLGGSDHPANLKLVCVQCHRKYNEKFNGHIKRANRAKAKALDSFELREGGGKLTVKQQMNC